MRARTTPAGESSVPSIDSERRDAPLNAEVASRAYAIWLGRGRPEGTDREDWLEAERQLREERGGRAALTPTLAAEPAREPVEGQ